MDRRPFGRCFGTVKILRIGLVVEGKTDHIVIKALFQHRISTLRPHAQVRFIEIQPYLDETGASTPGGWTHVYAWCMRNSPEARESLYLGRPLFANTADANRCDVLVVALDSDASAEIASKFSLAPPPPPQGCSTLIRFPCMPRCDRC